MSDLASALARAEALVAGARDDPEARLAHMGRVFHGPTGHVERYIADERRLGRMLDYAVIVPRLQRLYEWFADELTDPRVLGLVRDGSPIYAWPFEERHVWRSRHMPFAARVLERVTRPSTQTGAFRA